MLKAAADVFDQRRRFEASNFGVCIVMAVVDPNGAVSADGPPAPNGLGPSETPSSGSTFVRVSLKISKLKSSKPGLATNSIFFCFLFVKTH